MKLDITTTVEVEVTCQDCGRLLDKGRSSNKGIDREVMGLAVRTCRTCIRMEVAKALREAQRGEGHGHKKH